MGELYTDMVANVMGWSLSLPQISLRVNPSKGRKSMAPVKREKVLSFT